MKILTFILIFFIPLLSSAQTLEQEKVVNEFVKRYNNGNDDIVKLDSLISQSLDTLRSAYLAFDTNKAFEEIEKIEKIYKTGKSSKDDDFKYHIKFSRAELYAIDNNNDEALRLLRELKGVKPEYIETTLYNCSFATLHQNPEYIKLAYDPLTVYFAEIKPVTDSLRKYVNAGRPEDILKCLDIRDSLYALLSPDNRARVSYQQDADVFYRAAAYSMKGNIEDAVKLLKELYENGRNYAVNITINDNAFKNIKHNVEYQKMISGMTCNCGEIFDWVVTEFEKSDAGFDYALEMKGRETYEKHTAEKRAESKPITLPNDCVKTVNEWLKFFRKTHIGFFINSPTFADSVNDYDKYAIKRLSGKTMYIKIKSFSGNLARQNIARMINANDYLISNTPNLIIDLRGNGGGSDDAWSPLCKYIDSRPFNMEWNLRRVSEENAKLFEEYGEKGTAEYIRNNAGKRLAGNSAITTRKPDRIQKYPANIVILTDNGTGSSSESLLRYAKQSSKVKVMGQKTAGAEEIGNCVIIESPDKQFQLFYGTTIRAQAKHTQYLDYGIQPDIFLTSDLDWIEMAREYLEFRQ